MGWGVEKEEGEGRKSEGDKRENVRGEEEVVMRVENRTKEEGEQVSARGD